MHIVHLTASRFFGGPERQMLGLACTLPSTYRSSFVAFSEKGGSQEFLTRVREQNFSGTQLQYDTPHIRGAISELTSLLREQKANILISHGYKSNLVGRFAARKLGIPIVSVSRGWTGENWKIRIYETIDRFQLRFMDRVICVSEGQAKKVRQVRVPNSKLHIIRNAARLQEFQESDPQYREYIRSFFPAFQEGDLIALAAGRLSPDKGFDILINAVRLVNQQLPNVRFLIFGNGVERANLENQIRSLQLQDSIVLGGFRLDLDRFFPWADLVVLSSYTEGLPNVLLEASAAGRPIVSTAVGGTPEIVDHGKTGFLVPAGNVLMLAESLIQLGRDADLRMTMGKNARALVEERFTFEAQSRAYEKIFHDVIARR
jgi:glycosyltransferase involved in cell wall biosynthesis